jgi:hypothetical protein
MLGTDIIIPHIPGFLGGGIQQHLGPFCRGDISPPEQGPGDPGHFTLKPASEIREIDLEIIQCLAGDPLPIPEEGNHDMFRQKLVRIIPASLFLGIDIQQPLYTLG